MKPNAFLRFKYSGEYYKFVVYDQGDEAQIDYYYGGIVSLTVDLDDNQRVTFKTEEPLPIGSLIANVKDSNGNLILDDVVWQIQTLAPVMNNFNSVAYYRSRAIKYQGELDVRST